MTRSRKFPSALLSLAAVVALILFLIFPARYAASVKEGIALWAVSVLPATLPFLFLTAFLTRQAIFSRIARCFSPISQRLFGVSGAGACCMLISAVSGYPVGARTVLDLTNAGCLDHGERFRTAALSTTTGPAFLIGAVGYGMFHNSAIGWLLFASHLIGIYAVGIVMHLRTKHRAERFYLPASPPFSLSEALSNSVLSVLCVGGAIGIFYAFGAMIADIGAACRVPTEITAVLRGLLEMTTGCSLFSEKTTALSLAFCSFFVTFGGLCVLVQQLAFLIPAGISAPRFILIKFLQGIVAALGTFLLATLAGI